MIFKQGLRQILHCLGLLLGIMGIVFVAQRLAMYHEQIDLTSINIVGYAAIGVLSIAHGASNVLLAAGWHDILARLGVERTFRWTIWAYAMSQLAKYVPGNIFHLLGRQALGASAAISHGSLAKSAVMELAIIAFCTVFFLPLLLPVAWPKSGAFASVVLFVAVILSSIILTARFLGQRLARSAAFYSAYLTISGTIFISVYLLCGGEAGPDDMPTIAGAYVLAWLVGLCTPGAPAGLGVREAVLLTLLTDIAAPPVILLAVVMGRVVTVLGDFEFYLAGGLLDPRRTI